MSDHESGITVWTAVTACEPDVTHRFINNTYTPTPATDLKTRIAGVLREHLIGVVGGDAPADEFDCCADAIIAMPEMAAIRRSLYGFDMSVGSVGLLSLPTEGDGFDVSPDAAQVLSSRNARGDK